MEDFILSRILHCVGSIRIRSYSGPHFPAFELNTERYGVSLRIQSEYRKLRPEKLLIRTLFTQCWDDLPRNFKYVFFTACSNKLDLGSKIKTDYLILKMHLIKKLETIGVITYHQLVEHFKKYSSIYPELFSNIVHLKHFSKFKGRHLPWRALCSKMTRQDLQSS